MSDSEPTNCSRCNTSLEGKRYVTYYTATKKKLTVDEVLCQKCDEIKRWDNYAKTDIISTSMYMELIYLHGEYARKPHPHLDDTLILRVVEETISLEEHVNIFESLVWLGNPPLQKVVDNCRTHGMKYEDKSSKVTFMTYDIAGRVMITVENKTASITLITGSDYKESGHMGIQGINATAKEAKNLLDWTITNHEIIVKKIKSDTKVNMGF